MKFAPSWSWHAHRAQVRKKTHLTGDTIEIRSFRILVFALIVMLRDKKNKKNLSEKDIERLFHVLKIKFSF